MTTQPSVKQVVNRADDGHRKLLRAYVDGIKLDPRTMGELRGLRTCLETLGRWGCIETNKITDRGRELLAALDERHNAWLRRMGGRPGTPDEPF